jgi:Flp pilus assembly protein TadG
MRPPGWFSDQSGVAAIEFAIIAPLLGLMLLAIVDSWSLASSALAMRAGISAAANYIIQGGRTDATAQALALSAWQDAPADAAVTVSRVCSCSGTVVGCSTLCTGTSKPASIFVHVLATGTWTGPFTTDYMPITLTLSREQVVRLR